MNTNENDVIVPQDKKEEYLVVHEELLKAAKDIQNFNKLLLISLFEQKEDDKQQPETVLYDDKWLLVMTIGLSDYLPETLTHALVWLMLTIIMPQFNVGNRALVTTLFFSIVRLQDKPLINLMVNMAMFTALSIATHNSDAVTLVLVYFSVLRFMTKHYTFGMLAWNLMNPCEIISMVFKLFVLLSIISCMFIQYPILISWCYGGLILINCKKRQLREIKIPVYFATMFILILVVKLVELASILSIITFLKP